MKQLTLQYAIDNKFTWYDCVRWFKPFADESYCDFLLWEKTCYPFDPERTIQMLNELFLKETPDETETVRPNINE